MMPTSRLPGTVFRSSAEWPCTSALGLLIRRYSAGRSNFWPSSKLTVSVLRSLCRRTSVGQICGAEAISDHEPDCAGIGNIVAAQFLGACGQRVAPQEPHELLQRRLE